MVKPITPEEVTAKTHIPDFVIDCFNYYIKRNFHGKYSVIKQGEIVTAIITWVDGQDGLDEWNKAKSVSMEHARNYIFDHNWLDVEKIFRGVGWTVEYEQPARGETFEAYFTFTPPRKQTSLIMG